MKLIIITALFMSLAVASPVAVSDDDGSAQLSKRSNKVCHIVNTDSAAVHCRSGPALSYPSVIKLGAGDEYMFSCYKRGDCYEGNCTWDKLTLNPGCYVNGYYTDGNCTAAGLGLC